MNHSISRAFGTYIATALIAATLTACSSDSGGDSRNFETLGGTVTLNLPNGYPSSTVNIQLTNGAENKTVSVDASGSGNNAFTFPTALQSGSSYRVMLQTDSSGTPIQPLGLMCVLSNDTGTIDANSTAKVRVSCSAKPYQVKIAVSGLFHGGVQLQSGNDTLPVSPESLVDGFAVLPTWLPFNATYGVTIQSRSVAECVLASNAGVVSETASPIGMTCTTPEVAVLAGAIPDAGGNAGNSGTDPRQASFGVLNTVAVDAEDNVFIAEQDFNRIRKIANTREVTVFAGSGSPGSSDGGASVATFNRPMGLAVDVTGTLFIADANNHKIRVITPQGEVSTFAGSGVGGSDDGVGSAASFSSPSGVAVDRIGNVYVADAGNRKVRKITRQRLVSTLAGPGMAGTCNETPGETDFIWPSYLAVDAAGSVYVTNGVRAEFPIGVRPKICKITAQGGISVFAGSGVRGSIDGVGTAASFHSPQSIAVDSTGNLYLADYVNQNVRKITSEGVVTTFAGSGTRGAFDGTGTAARFSFPLGVAVDATDNIFVAEQWDIRRITPTGIVSTFAGSQFGSTVGADEGLGTAARFNEPSDVTFDTSRNLYVADFRNNKIRKITPNGTVSTLAGSGEPGFLDGPGAAARFFFLGDLAADRTGNVYAADRGNHRIRKIAPDGTVTTLAGSGAAGSSDGIGSAASFDFPSGVAVDMAGNVYVADTGSNKVRKVTPAGVVSTLAGSGTAASIDGTGTAASFAGLSHLAIDSVGNLFVANGGQSIRKVTPLGVVTTLVALPTRASDVAVDGSGNVYFSDTDNTSIYQITPGGSVAALFGSTDRALFMPGPAPGKVGRVTGIAISPPSQSGNWNMVLAIPDQNAIAQITNANVYVQ